MELGGLEADYKQVNPQDRKRELIDTIMRSRVSKTVRASVPGILDVIGRLALWHIREVEARALATEREHVHISQEDKSNAATVLQSNIFADRSIDVSSKSDCLTGDGSSTLRNVHLLLAIPSNKPPFNILPARPPSNLCQQILLNIVQRLPNRLHHIIIHRRHSDLPPFRLLNLKTQHKRRNCT
jgi:hypothetical protein